MPKEHLKYMGNIIPQKVVFLTFKTDLFSLEKDATQYFFLFKACAAKTKHFKFKLWGLVGSKAWLK